MDQRGKCCAHCPGNFVSSSLKDSNEAHECCLPTYVRGNMKLSSSTKSNAAERNERLVAKATNSKRENERSSSCRDRFALAKKFHAENLRHQPLPDRVDDSLFKNFPATINIGNAEGNADKNLSSSYNRRDARGSRLTRRIRAGLQYGPTLGCKTPTTNMDLAICWEAPLDPTYEPPRAMHIDGTEGGPAPAIFALVEPEFPNEVKHCSTEKLTKNPLHTYEAKFNNLRNRCGCRDDFSQNPKERESRERCNEPLKCPERIKKGVKKRSSHLAKELCDNFESFHISEDPPEARSRPDSSSRKKRQPVHLRNCAKCECRGEHSARKPRQRFTQSAYAGTRNLRRNGLPTKINVPRPRTPYAKRSYCIDSLKPPFSIVEGCRDADYPEHWRLTSVYQQSYRNPTKQRGTILNWN